MCVLYMIVRSSGSVVWLNYEGVVRVVQAWMVLRKEGEGMLLIEMGSFCYP